MKYSNVIEMDIWSNFGCFRKPFSTTGGIKTYLIPPKTSIIGLIGAVLGYEFNDFNSLEDDVKEYKIESLFDIKISIQPLFDLKTKQVIFNRVSGDINNINIENIRQDVLIKPYYKIFVCFPDILSNEEKIFINRIKNSETIYSLYMGKNEFPLSFDLCKIHERCNILRLNKTNCADLFEENNIKIVGLLNRELIKDTKMKKITSNSNEIVKIIFGEDESDFSSYYEYIIRQYPIKRENFINFSYCDISFFSSNEFGDCYISEFFFKDDIDNNKYIELIKIGEDKWICPI